MDASLANFACALAGCWSFGLIGAGFGGLVGHLSWKQGRPAGSAAGLAVARLVERFAGEKSAPGKTGFLVGATDGLIFLGSVGAVLGLLAARGHFGWAVLSRVGVGIFVLAVGAVFFGGLALGIIYAGSRAVAGVFAGGMIGAASGAALGRTDGLVIGALGGVLAGTLLGVAVTRGRR